MDDKWFKKRQKIAGVTAEDIAAEMGRSRSNVSHIYSGKQKMSLDWAKAFAKVLDVPLDEVLVRAGVTDTDTAQRAVPGFSDGDAVPFKGPEIVTRKISPIAAALGGDRPGVDVWQITSPAMSLQGYMPGDYMLVDTNVSETVRKDDVCLAQVYDWQTGSANTILRRFEPPVLVGASVNPKDWGVHVVDGSNVVIKGKVIGSWRA